MRTLPIRLRLATWYFVVFAAAQLAFGAAMWLALRHNLYAIVDENLDERVESVRRFIDSQKKNADLAKMREELAETYDIEPEGRYLQVYTGAGERVYQARALAGVALPPVRLTFEQPGPAYSDLNVEQQPLRFAAQRVAAHGSTYVVQIGASTAQTREALARFLWGLLLIAPTLLLIASFGGYLISRRALAPVDAITSQARAIGERSLKNRLQKLATHDELQRLSDTLNEMLERIEISFRRVTRFTADASHELRTPLSLIRMESELALRKQREPAEYREALRSIHFQSEKTSELLEDLLALARGDAGRETLQFTPVDLCVIVRAADSWRRPAAEKMLRFSHECPDDPIWVHGDQGALERLVTILLDNALKYTSPGGCVTVSLSENLGLAELTVTDTGIGIAPEHHRKIFERFYRVDDARSRLTGGSGLGLAIAEWIITQHNGSIQVSSTPGVGSTFVVLIPLARQDDSSSAADVGTEQQLGKRQLCPSATQSPKPREIPEAYDHC